MRFAVIFVAFVFVSTASAHLAQFAGAIEGISALSTSIAGITKTFLPSGLLLPMAAVAPLKLTLPAILGLKALGLLKYKLMMAKAPFLAPVAIASAKFGLLKAKYSLGKAALKTMGKTTVDLFSLPVQLAAGKIGAASGAVAGASAGLAAYKVHSRKDNLKGLAEPALAFLDHSKGLLKKVKTPMKTVTFEVKTAPVYAAPEAPVYTTPTPAYIPEVPAYVSEAPAYVPEVPAYTPETPAYEEKAPAYRRRRDVSTEGQEALPAGALETIFEYMQKLDTDKCVHRLMCELAVEPELAGSEFSDVTDFIKDLPSTDPSAAWMTFKNASDLGATARSRDICNDQFKECQRSTTSLIETAKKRLAGDEE